ncbi:MAG: PAS domain S-box protein [Betaproteobacteria bacterium]|nr:MAG: PAS domain S-box protein [Betaproteobacteria bacterium]
MPRTRQVAKARATEAAVRTAKAGSPAPVDAALQLVEALPVPMFVKSRDGRYLGVNRAWEEFFGVSRASFLGKQVQDLYPQNPAIAEKHLEMDGQLWRNPGGQSYEATVTARDGRLRDTIYYKATFANGSGEVAGLMGAIVDITARKQAEASLLESERRFRRTFELAGSGVAHIGMDRRFLRVNRRLCEILGYPQDELLRLTGRQISHPDDLDVINAQRPRLYAGEIDSVRVEKRYLRKDGSIVWVSFTMVVERDAAGKPQYEIAFFDDITARKQAEAALRESEERFRSVVDSANDGILVYDKQLNVIAGNLAAERILGLPLANIIGAAGFTSLLPCVHADGSPILPDERPTRLTVKSGKPLTGQIVGIYRADGSMNWVSVNTGFLRRPGDTDWYGVVSTIGDITKQRHAELALSASEALYRQTFELATAGIAHVDLSGRFMKVNRRLCEILGYGEQELIGRPVKEISHPEDRNLTDSQRMRVRSGEKPSVRFEKRYLRKSGAIVWVDLSVALACDASGVPQYEIALFDDITERKKAEAALREAHEELKRSNAELEQFAYVASHDLQEPLRMVSSYTQLLMRRYGDKLDGDAREFTAFIVDGATRMKQLIEDLLAYSRVGTRDKNFKPVDAESSLKRALTNLRAAIQDSGATVTQDKLPTIPCDEVQLAQLFQNLIGNALKFRKPDVAPAVHVGAAEQGAEWEFMVRDNGIGIEPQYFERIFMVFQRLHDKGEYPGTGIGLAIVKKVVERHGGRIWVQSQPGAGTTFHFTMPKERKAANG